MTAAPVAVNAQPILSISGLTANYGLARALTDVSFDVPQGSCVAVLGANGAGKTTLARVLTGLVPAARGKVLLDGRDITNWPTHRVARAGITHVPAERMILPGLSVIDNLRSAVRWAAPRGDRQAAIEKALGEFPALASRTKQLAGTLSGGEQQMLSLARALAVPPRLVIADELSHGLAPILVAQVFDSLAKIRAQGTTVIIIEQFVGAALELADSAVILRRGELAWSGAASEAGGQLAENYLE